ncbi:MAG: diguanylate cyclase [Magnetovibrionaceae bacterium]
MPYHETFADSHEHAKAALALMDQHGIPAHPTHFTVWYAYSANLIPDLVKAINDEIERSGKLDVSSIDELFTRFFSFDEEGVALNHVSSRVEGELSELISVLEQAAGQTSEYGALLDAVGGGLEQADQQLTELLRRARDATKQMYQNTQRLEARLSASTHEIEKLRGDLEVMRKEALTDSLTGLANRKLFDAELRAAALSADQSDKTFCLLMIDVDHFKAFNDNHGHQMGDEVLRLLAVCMRNTIKGRDTAARYGGEEFCIILPYTPLSGGITLADALRRIVRSRKIVSKRSRAQLGRITVSIGVAEYQNAEPLSQLLSRADAALYLAKRAGRDRVVGEDSLDAESLTFD